DRGIYSVFGPRDYGPAEHLAIDPGRAVDAECSCLQLQRDPAELSQSIDKARSQYDDYERLGPGDHRFRELPRLSPSQTDRPHDGQAVQPLRPDSQDCDRLEEGRAGDSVRPGRSTRSD